MPFTVKDTDMLSKLRIVKSNIEHVLDIQKRGEGLDDDDLNNSSSF